GGEEGEDEAEDPRDHEGRAVEARIVEDAGRDADAAARRGLLHQLRAARRDERAQGALGVGGGHRLGSVVKDLHLGRGAALRQLACSAREKAGGMTSATPTSPPRRPRSISACEATGRSVNHPLAAMSATRRRLSGDWSASRTARPRLWTSVEITELNASNATSGTAIRIETVNGSRKVARTSRRTSVQRRRRLMRPALP